MLPEKMCRFFGGSPPKDMWLWFKTFSNVSVCSDGKEEWMPIPFLHRAGRAGMGTTPGAQTQCLAPDAVQG